MLQKIRHMTMTMSGLLAMCLMTTNKSPTGQMLHSPGSDEVCQSVHLHVDGQELQVE